MSARSDFDIELQSTERTASQARDSMLSLRESPSPLNSPHESQVPATSNGVTGKTKTKRAIIMKNKQKLRYRYSKFRNEVEERIHPKNSTQELMSIEENNPVLHTIKPKDSFNSIPKRLDKYGFILNMDANGNVYPDSTDEEDIPSFAAEKENERKERQWGKMMQTWSYTKRRRKLLSRHLREGIPDSIRGSVWILLGNVRRKIEEASLSYDDHVRKTLESTGDMVVKVPRMRSESLVNSPSFMVTQETIERDIHRTYPRHNMFHEDTISEKDEDIGLGAVEDNEDIVLGNVDDDDVDCLLKALGSPRKPEVNRKNFHIATGGQAALRRVLRAYSVYDRDVGYCQGMNFIAGMFLTFMTEEEAFWLLVYVMNDPPCRMRGLFGEGMKDTHVVLYIAERLVYQFLPRLAKHMESQSIHITMFATQWLLTLYTSSFQFDLVTRVWDCFLAEGYKIVYRVMLALLQQSQTTLLRMSFEDILAFFREIPKQTNGGEIIEVALKIPLRRKHLEKYEKEFHSGH